MTETLLTIVALLLLTNLVLTLLANERIRNAIRQGNRQALDLGLARLEALREQLNRQVVVQPEEIVSRLGRLALEATGEPAGIDQVLRVLGQPFPAVVALGKNFAEYIFSPVAPDRIDGLLGLRSRYRALPINATTSLTATAELAAIWTMLAGQHLQPEDRVLPRTTSWYLYIVPQSGPRPG